MRRQTEFSFGPVALTLDRRLLLVGTGLAVAAVAAFLVSIAIGFTSPVDVARILLGGGTRAENVVVFDDALPRALVAALVGFGLGLAGALTQTITRNPLATPDLLGITAGAGFGAVLAITTTGSWAAGRGVGTAALLGGLAAAAVMYLLSLRRGSDVGMSTLRLILIGVGLTWMLQALTGYLLVRAQEWDAARAQRWIVGSVSLATWQVVPAAAAAVLIGLGWAVVAGRDLRALGLGQDLARSLGVRVGPMTAGTLLVAVVVASLAVSAAGPIAFVGLLAPQIGMRLTGTAQPTPVAAGFTGALLVLAADIVLRTVLPAGLPVGVVTAAVGGPFLIYLMVQASRKATA
ncbi:putative ABC transporter permease protein [Gordonia hirsuta DSM 44140 = NBRC 16056]|uniref:Putative ABC transporter permease protein n=1 Tax=Gordonia hirsuta DSM 44140 = NBRC 16056 TaxID=1121927 RepID=L7LE53_9ACTN|nr:iron ABC transporter permease [Gordonia hirsuta]GAC59001.1 putative ABC transporter permease protein [Gordonia hirsuta DSM 44140 = NBRC 16056]